jgi:CDP-diacylglycerol pyrophosphatase
MPAPPRSPDRPPRLRRARILPAALAVFAIVVGVPLIVKAALGGSALWLVVHDLCVRDMRLTGRPAPCAKVELDPGYAVVEVLDLPTEVIVVPTARITGIEDPRLLAPGAPNYWKLAWANRGWLERRAGRPLARQDVGLVVNSAYGRSQDQLHIHIDCLRADVVARLAAHAGAITPTWRRLDVPLFHRRYAARWLSEAELDVEDPFRLLAALPAARADMGSQTLVMVGAVSPAGEPGFVLLNDAADPQGRSSGHGEMLLDHGCAGRR